MSYLGEWPDSDRDSESSFADSIDDDHNGIATTSPVEESSWHDEYTPPKNNRKSSTIYSKGPESGSDKSISSKTRDEFQKMCKKIYGGPICLVTGISDPIVMQMAYVIPRRTKGNMLTLYEYCLGLEFKTLHVDSRTNLFPLNPSWHTLFDKKTWLLLPDAATMRDVHNHVKAVIEWRQSLNSKVIIPLRSQWPSNTKTQYSFISISCTAYSISLKKDGDFFTYQHPFSNFPLLESHILPPYAVINAAQKLSRNQIDGIVRDRHAEQTKEFEELKQRLTLMCDTWDLFMGAKGVAMAWGKSEVGDKSEVVGNRKRKQSDSGQTDRHGTRSKTRSAHGGHRKHERPPDSSGATLTKHAVSRLEKQKSDDWEVSIRQWVAESTRVSSSVDPNLPLDFALA
ncbi:hypothetical protein DFJ58DRAFT_914230 [Suillus subalutaceus]|uniref:uncharacterized protein n=1 Tax=Suillus subalutaceus TaxID=48586 RepID=UPI001B8786CD|nr:uncharacterized protein DFJ58DRAFT_914230 [Suillus subalutaceus]KAG1853485.1 hypothetical protein DFJ58DRAFT_914230 [Suillus subalutaceus]